MPRFTTLANKPVQPKRHESRNQEQRHERIAEAERLEGLKRLLKIKVQASEDQAA